MFRAFIPGTEVNVTIRPNLQAHVFPSHVMVGCFLHIPEISVRSPDEFRRVSCHVQRHRKIVFQSRVIPPLPKKDVQIVFLKKGET